MTDVIRILSAIEQGDSGATEELLPLVYDELRKLAAQKLAQEKPGQTLQATALVHEAYLRLVGDEDAPRWESRGHFFAAAAEAMRRILIDAAKAKQCLKRGGERKRVGLEEVEATLGGSAGLSADLMLDLDDALTRLRAKDATTAELVTLRLFAGLSVTEAGEALGLSRSTAYENWEYAQAWFALHVGDAAP